eukprot:gb/GEZN01001454.1/.p1 GENE.gb/GEZN01001454.1/~~gb/GEZN01001454.1/.p1  ORF type:complete len:898 (+),score=101.15 gb/GEZN01001454.1/:80-2773(+)
MESRTSENLDKLKPKRVYVPLTIFLFTIALCFLAVWTSTQQGSGQSGGVADSLSELDVVYQNYILQLSHRVQASIQGELDAAVIASEIDNLAHNVGVLDDNHSLDRHIEYLWDKFVNSALPSPASTTWASSKGNYVSISRDVVFPNNMEMEFVVQNGTLCLRCPPEVLTDPTEKHYYWLDFNQSVDPSAGGYYKHKKYDARQRTWYVSGATFQQTKDQRGVWSGPTQFSNGLQAGLSFARPLLRKGSSEVVGVISSDVIVNSFSDHLAQLSTNSRSEGQDVDMAVVSANGYLRAISTKQNLMVTSEEYAANGESEALVHFTDPRLTNLTHGLNLMGTPTTKDKLKAQAQAVRIYKGLSHMNQKLNGVFSNMAPGNQVEMTSDQIISYFRLTNASRTDLQLFGFIFFPLVSFSYSFFLQTYVILLPTLFNVCSVVCVGMLITYRQHPVVKAGSLNFQVLIVLGTMLSYCSVYLLLVNPPTDVSCSLQPWMGHTAFGLVFGCFFTKSRRVLLIFNSTSLRVVVISNRELVSSVFGWVGSVWMYCLVWQLVDPVRAVAQVTSNIIIWRCKSQWAYWNLLLLTLEGLMLGYGVSLSLRTSFLPTAFNEGQHMGHAIYMMTFLSFVFLILSKLFSVLPDTVILLQATALCVVPAVVTAAIIGPKLWLTTSRDMTHSEFKDEILSDIKSHTKVKQHHDLSKSNVNALDRTKSTSVASAGSSKRMEANKEEGNGSQQVLAVLRISHSMEGSQSNRSPRDSGNYDSGQNGNVEIVIPSTSEALNTSENIQIAKTGEARAGSKSAANSRISLSEHVISEGVVEPQPPGLPSATGTRPLLQPSRKQSLGGSTSVALKNQQKESASHNRTGGEHLSIVDVEEIPADETMDEDPPHSEGVQVEQSLLNK